jgi:lysine 2,3-aminomutase
MTIKTPVTCLRQTPRPQRWLAVSETDWQDWRWQLSHRIGDLTTLSQLIQLTPEEKAGLDATGKFRVDITPYFASLIDPDNPDCPIRRQVLPWAENWLPLKE